MNIKDLDIDWLRNQIGFVSQEPVLFGGTIRENIAYGLPASHTWMPDDEYAKLLLSPEVDAKIRFAAKQANALNFIENFPVSFYYCFFIYLILILSQKGWFGY